MENPYTISRDSKTTEPASMPLMAHRLKYTYDPAYRYQVDLVEWQNKVDQPLVDASFDVIPAAASISSGIGRAAGVAGKYANDLSNLKHTNKVDSGIDNTSRRDAMKIGGAVGLGGVVAIKDTLPSLTSMVLGKAPVKATNATGINLAELGAKAKELTEIKREMFRGGIPKNTEAARLITAAKQGASNLASKFPMKNEQASGSFFHRAAGNVEQEMEITKKIADYKAIMKSRGQSPDPKKLDRYSKELKAYGAKLPDDMWSKMTKQDKQDWKAVVDSKKFYYNLDNTLDTMKHTRDTALSSDKAVLDLDSIKSELARTNDRIAEYSKAPGKQKRKVYEYDEYDRPTGKSAIETVDNVAKNDKLSYLQTRKERLMSQIDDLAGSGKYKDVELPRYSNMKNSDYHRVNRNPGNSNKFDRPDDSGLTGMFRKYVDEGPQ